MNHENNNSYSKQGTITTLTEELSGPTSILFKGHKLFTPAAFSSLDASPAGWTSPISVKQAQELSPC